MEWGSVRLLKRFFKRAHGQRGEEAGEESEERRISHHRNLRTENSTSSSKRCVCSWIGNDVWYGMAKDLFFEIYDVIAEDLVKIWVRYIPPNNSLSTPRVYHEVYEDNESQTTNAETEQQPFSVGSQIWLEVMKYLPVSYLDSSLLGRSHRVRFIRELSQNSILFPKHYDEQEVPYPLERFAHYEITAQLTILIYLNEGFVGGTARFYLDENEYREVVPKPGRVVIFDRRILHCALPLNPSFVPCDKCFLKCCALYGRRKSELPSAGHLSVSIFDETSQLIDRLRIFKETSDPESKVCAPAHSLSQFTLFPDKKCSEDL
jgi:hypothetical protein